MKCRLKIIKKTKSINISLSSLWHSDNETDTATSYLLATLPQTNSPARTAILTPNSRPDEKGHDRFFI